MPSVGLQPGVFSRETEGTKTNMSGGYCIFSLHYYESVSSGTGEGTGLVKEPRPNAIIFLAAGAEAVLDLVSKDF